MPGLLLFAALALVAPVAPAAELVHYGLTTELEPATHHLTVLANIQLPPQLAGKRVEFFLASGLRIERSTPRIRSLGGAGKRGFTGINGSSTDFNQETAGKHYEVTLPRGSSTLTLTYSGEMNFPLMAPPEEYARSFQETPGIVSPKGVYLVGSSLWYPFFGDGLVTFDIDAHAPEGWQLVAPGNGVARDDKGRAHWSSGGAVDEIELVGGPLIRYARSAGGVEALVYLRQPDDALAEKYLEATTRYIAMYGTLIGPYPYEKFALVENFWETGYGMPSFTLLGPQIIRFPFILTSSYPHEILHNWWGNSVFVDYGTGNWCEGLTAYLADHLLKEQQGEGAEYRRDTLKKYRDFVKDGRDFPLTEFRTRRSAATEAVGYGKTMMGFHMLRLRLGDEAFKKALATFYREYRGRRASFADVRSVFEAAGGGDLSRFFHEWVELPGAADLAVENVSVSRDGNAYTVRGVLRQRQARPFELDVPVVINAAGGVTQQSIRLNSAATPFAMVAKGEPLSLEVDPEFDVFRELDARETAPSIGQLFGDKDVLVVLPSGASEADQRAYRDMAEGWRSPSHVVTVVSDADLTELPAGKAAWLFGRDNRLAAAVFKDDPAIGFATSKDSVTAGPNEIPIGGHAIVVTRRNPADVSKAVGWIVADAKVAADLGRKLPHYGKYSYLGFDGPDLVNTVKGEWPAADSPLLIAIGAGPKTPAPVQFAPRRALAELPPEFSKDKLLGHVRYLADPAQEGRGVGTGGLDRAGDYVAKEFAAAGLKPGGDNGGYFQRFMIPSGPDGKPHELRNIIGYLPGGRTGFKNQAALVTAHYDHLGHGWPDVRAAEKNQLYPGADDNASGIAVLLEVAKAFAAGPAPDRALVFVAFSGEEAGLRGSKYYVEHPSPVPLNGIIGVINMDAVGRLGDHPVSVLATASASEWPSLFRDVSATTGIKSQSIEGASQSSDQQSFIQAGIPGVQIFSGVNLDYHRPSDTFDKIDGDGLVNVAAFVREAAAYLAARPDPLNFQSPPGGSSTAPVAEQGAPAKSRRVSLGTVPDFAFKGPGIRVDAVVPGSPAAQSDIRPGDVITALDDTSIQDLAGFSETLKRYAPGQGVTVAGQRGGAPFKVNVILQIR